MLVGSIMEVQLIIALSVCQDISFFKGTVLRVVQADTLNIMIHIHVKVTLKHFQSFSPNSSICTLGCGSPQNIFSIAGYLTELPPYPDLMINLSSNYSTFFSFMLTFLNKL